MLYYYILLCITTGTMIFGDLLKKDEFDHFLIGIWKVCVPLYGFVDDETVGGFQTFWV